MKIKLYESFDYSYKDERRERTWNLLAQFNSYQEAAEFLIQYLNEIEATQGFYKLEEEK